VLPHNIDYVNSWRFPAKTFLDYATWDAFPARAMPALASISRP